MCTAGDQLGELLRAAGQGCSWATSQPGSTHCCLATPLALWIQQFWGCGLRICIANKLRDGERLPGYSLGHTFPDFTWGFPTSE